MIILVMVAACLLCGMIGCFAGYMVGIDRQPAPPPAPEPLTVVTARESYDFWEEVRPGSHARTSPRVTGGFPALPAAQPPLRELVHAGRTTDVIEKMRADTDRWLAARGLEDG